MVELTWIGEPFEANNFTCVIEIGLGQAERNQGDGVGGFGIIRLVSLE